MSVAVHYVVDADPDLVPDAPVVVLSNSLGSTYRMWDAQVAVLSRYFRVVRYDTRGHGRSPVPPGPYTIDDLVDDVVRLLDSLEQQRVHFVGLSLGGMTGLRLAVREPARVERLAVLCSSAWLEPASAWRERAAVVRARGCGAVAASVVERWYTQPWREAHRDLVAEAEAMVAATSAEGYAGCCEAIATMDQRADLPRLGAPTLAVAGNDDPVTPPSHLRAIAEGVQNGRLLVVDSAAHLANDEQPAAITAALLGHLRAAS